jgi:hypothetical protein
MPKEKKMKQLKHNLLLFIALGGMVYSTEPHSGEGSPLDAAVYRL